MQYGFYAVGYLCFKNTSFVNIK